MNVFLLTLMIAPNYDWLPVAVYPTEEACRADAAIIRQTEALLPPRCAMIFQPTVAK